MSDTETTNPNSAEDLWPQARRFDRGAKPRGPDAAELPGPHQAPRELRA